MCDNDKFSFLNSFILAILVGFLVGLLVFLGIILDITIPLIITIASTFIIAIAFFVVIILPRYYRCLRKYSCIILIGIIGTIIFSSIAINIELGANIISAIIIGLTGFFFAYLIIEFIKLLTCIINRNEIIMNSFNNQTENLNNINEDDLNIISNVSNVENNSRYCNYK